eukprot:SAG22_NODE_9565_length_582_cov_5.890269_2_plen_131_part_01
MDIASGIDFSNAANAAVSERNRAAIGSARQLTALRQQGADAVALAKQQSDRAGDYAGDARDLFGGALAGKYLNDEVMKGVLAAGGGELSMSGTRTYLGGELDKAVKKRSGGQSLEQIAEGARSSLGPASAP